MTGASSAYKLFKELQVMGDALSGARGHREELSDGRVWVLEMLLRRGEAEAKS